MARSNLDLDQLSDDELLDMPLRFEITNQGNIARAQS